MSTAANFAFAVQCFQAGQLPQAEAACRALLQAEPAHAEALHLLGLVALQSGRPAAALEHVEQALAVRPTQPAFHSSRGLALQTLGRREEAAEAYRQALALAPGFAGAHNNLGAVLRELGKWDEAETHLRQALQLRPNHAGALYNLGEVQRGRARWAEAADCYRRALQADPRHAPSWLALGEVSRKQQQYAAAADCYREAVRLRPDAAAYHGLGTALLRQRRFAEAVAPYREAVRLAPHLAEIHNSLGCALKELWEFDEAEVCLRRALELKPDYPAALTNLGNVLHARAAFAEAGALYERALALDPDFPEAHTSRADLRLTLGDYAGGWADYEWRWRSAWNPTHRFTPPLWDGSPLDGKTILLHAEQGNGDVLQFIRYAALVKRRGGTVYAECWPPLVPLLRRCPGIDRLFSFGAALPAFDVHAPLMSLPHVFGTTLTTVPADVPYLTPDPVLVERWRRELAGVTGFKVGINWRGNPQNTAERVRAMPLASFARLAAVPGVRLVSLHRGAGQEELRVSSLPALDFGDRLDREAGAFMDTAAVMTQMDLVISSDTAIAHLAGALGVAVWVGLPHHAEWRWLLDREDSPWYPTMRLFRQSAPGDWDGVLARMEQVLRERVR